MNKLDLDYQNLLKDILDNGTKKETRNGGTISVFGRQIRHKMSDGFPLITTKKMYMKGIITELLWFLRGDTNIKYLVDNDCHIWDGDAYKRYSIIAGVSTQVEALTQEEFINKIKTDNEFAKQWGELGPIYGKQWRSWETMEGMKVEGNGYTESMVLGWKLRQDEHGNITDGRIPIDQIANSINLLKTDPDSRRNRVSAWNVGEIDEMTLPPCHTDFQFYTRELSLEDRYNWYINIYNKNLTRSSNQFDMDEILNSNNVPTRAISLMYNARSQDVPLGTPFNITSYGLLLEIIAKMVNMVPDELITNMGDCHIYLNQIDGVKEQLMREPYPLPKLVISNQVNYNEGIDEFLDSCLITDFVLENYQSHPTIKMPLSN